MAAQSLGVPDDGVGAEVGEVLGLLLRHAAGEDADRRGAPCAALVEHQHPELPQRALEPGRRAGPPARAWGLEARAALQVDEERPVRALRVGDLAREDGELLAAGRAVVDRDGELVVGQQQAGDAMGDGHETHPRMG